MVLSLLWAALLLSCRKEPENLSIPEIADSRITSVVHYRATAGEGFSTKASLNNSHQYIFDTGDQLYVTSGNNLYGVLNLVAGAGDPTGTFEGDLMCLNGFQLTDATSLSATLVSRDDKIHTCADGLIIGTPSYPDSDDDAFASSFAEAVRYFSDFTATSTFGAHAFSLEQQSTFLVFSVTFDDTEATTITNSGSSTIKATITNGGSTVRSGNVDVEVIDFSDQANFVAAFPASTVLSGATVYYATSDNNSPIGSPDAINDATLSANRYYEISRSHVDLRYFTIQAKETGTTRVTFSFTGSGIQYKKQGDADFSDYDGSAIELTQGQYVQFRGKGTSYKGAVVKEKQNGVDVEYNTKWLFTSENNKVCYIYGDIMSLVCNNDYTPKSNLNSNAFQYAFREATWIDIPAGRPLKLTASTLGSWCYNQMFWGCTSLSRPPELKTTLAADIPSGAYSNMFRNCTSLVSAPDLPKGRTVGSQGYESMFSGCTSLITVPATLEGTSSVKACNSMFKGCSSLTNAPSLPSSSVGENGYLEMFRDCISLVQAPALPATTIGKYAYKNMFYGCTSLVSGPENLPATALADNCYEQMFRGCLALSSAPSVLPATASAPSCYASMFYGCISLNHAPEIKLEDIGTSSCKQMFYGCTSLVTAEGLENALTVAANGCELMFYNCGELTTTPSVLHPTSLPDYAYSQMYYGCAKITTAPDIKATSTSTYSCYRMFRGCRRLRTAPPKLAVETVADNAFNEMFYGCSSLSTAPDFTGMETVGLQGCLNMFNGCTNLTTAPALPAGTMEGGSLNKSAYQGMFQSSGLTAVPELLATELAESCYESMFQNCKYLKGPAVLPASELVTKCYRQMFYNSPLFDSIVCLATTGISTTNCENWLYKVSASGTFVRPAGVSDWTVDSASGIPTGWTLQNSGLDPIFPDDGPFDPEEDL